MDMSNIEMASFRRTCRTERQTASDGHVGQGRTMSDGRVGQGRVALDELADTEIRRKQWKQRKERKQRKQRKQI